MNKLLHFWKATMHLHTVSRFIFVVKHESCHKDQFWDPCCFVYTLMTYVTYLTRDASSTYYIQMTCKFTFKCQRKV